MNGRYPFLFCLQVIFQVALVRGAALGGLAGDAACADKRGQVGVQAVHTKGRAGLQDARDLVALASRIRFATASVPTRISVAAQRPLPTASGSSCWGDDAAQATAAAGRGSGSAHRQGRRR